MGILMGAWAAVLYTHFMRNHHVPVQDYQMQCLVNATWFEARNQTVNGIIGVENVIKNRVRSPRFPNSYCGVVFQKYQFSYLNNGKRIIYLHNDIDREVFKEIVRTAYLVVNHYIPDNTNGSMFYYSAIDCDPNWSRDAIRKTRIDDHVFVKLYKRKN